MAGVGSYAYFLGGRKCKLGTARGYASAALSVERIAQCATEFPLWRIAFFFSEFDLLLREQIPSGGVKHNKSVTRKKVMEGLK
jgi:hypothetical protein